MRSPTLLLALSLAATFVAFAAPAADACAGQQCIPGCQYSCPPGCGDNIPCCDRNATILECFAPCVPPGSCLPPIACGPLTCPIVSCVLDLPACIIIENPCERLAACSIIQDPCSAIALCGPLPGCGDNIPCCESILHCPIIYLP
jgi:hypothetical protein